MVCSMCSISFDNNIYAEVWVDRKVEGKLYGWHWKCVGRGAFEVDRKMRDKLQCVRAILQNRQTEAARIVTGLTTYATLSSLYAETWWEKLNTRREIRKLSALFYNIVKGDTPDYLSDLLPRTVNQANNYNLRNTNNFTIPSRVSSNPISKFILSSHYSSLE